jgi:hypothetical protein
MLALALIFGNDHFLEELYHGRNFPIYHLDSSRGGRRQSRRHSTLCLGVTLGVIVDLLVDGEEVAVVSLGHGAWSVSGVASSRVVKKMGRQEREMMGCNVPSGIQLYMPSRRQGDESFSYKKDLDVGSSSRKVGSLQYFEVRSTLKMEPASNRQKSFQSDRHGYLPKV